MFRLHATLLFLTYPKCTLSREDALQLLNEKPWGTANITHHLVAQERHEDGSPHLHCLLKLSKRKDIRTANFLDLGEFHGNYQAGKNAKYLFDYCTKADANALHNFTPDVLKPAKVMTRAVIGKRMLDGEKAEDLVDEYPQLLFGFKRLKDDVRCLEEAKEVVRNIPYVLSNPWGRLIFTEGGKKRHWWIWSRNPNRGKTTWARELADQFGAYIKGGDFTYWNVTGKEQLIILDEYNSAGMRFNTLNQLCDGLFEARVFMAGLRRLHPRLVIVLSNSSIRDIYPFKYDLVEARFIEFEIL